MAKLKDFEVVYTAYDKDKKSYTFKGNMWAGQEMFRRIFGPDTIVDSCDILVDDIVINIKDPINWNHPVCCDHCRDEAKERNSKKADVAQ